jgi:hypothetical protein
MHDVITFPVLPVLHIVVGLASFIKLKLVIDPPKSPDPFPVLVRGRHSRS